MTSKSELDQRIVANVAVQDTLTAALRTARQEDADAKVALEQAALDMAREEEYLSRAYQHKTYEIVQAPAWEQVKIDPRTGEANQDWSAIVIERALKDDVEWAERLGKFYKTQEAHVEARSVVHGGKAKMDTLMDQLASARSQANVLAEWLRFLAGGE